MKYIFLLTILSSYGESVEGTFWERPFWDGTTGEWFVSCHGQNLDPPEPPQKNITFREQTRPFIEHLKNGALEGEDLCANEEFLGVLASSEQLCMHCQFFCQRHEENSCFNTDTGATDLDINKYRERYCTFHIQLPFSRSISKREIRYIFPNKPESQDTRCEPDTDRCAHISRDCFHKNQTHDKVYQCENSAARCAHNDPLWLSQFEFETPDCASMTKENLKKYFFDIDHYKCGEPQEIERYIICDCNHPFRRNITYTNLPAFEDCKNNIELLFEEISELSELEQCQLVNVPETKIRINTQKPCPVQNNPCEVLKTFPKELVFGSVIFVVLVGVIFLGLFISRRRYGPTSTIPHTHSTAINSHSGQGQPLINGYASRENNNTPENNSAEAEICYAPSVEVKAIPRILERYLAENQAFADEHPSLTVRDILSGQVGRRLSDHIVDSRLSLEHTVDCLRDIAWWINALHGETTKDSHQWKIFHGAISPRNVAVVTIKQKLHALVVNYELAQDIHNNPDTVHVDVNEAKLNLKYLAPEMISPTERRDARCILSCDIYGFACIAWKLLRSLERKGDVPKFDLEKGPSSTSNEDPYDGIIAHRRRSLELEGKSSTDAEILSEIFGRDSTVRPNLSGLEVGNIQSQKLVKIIEECWSPQPILRLTGAQLFWKMKENFPENAIQSPIRTSYH